MRVRGPWDDDDDDDGDGDLAFCQIDGPFNCKSISDLKLFTVWEEEMTNGTYNMPPILISEMWKRGKMFIFALMKYGGISSRGMTITLCRVVSIPDKIWEA